MDIFDTVTPLSLKLTGGTPEVGSDKSLPLLTFDIFIFEISFLTYDILHYTFGTIGSLKAFLFLRYGHLKSFWGPNQISNSKF